MENNIKKIKENKDAFIQSASLYRAMADYSENQNSDTVKCLLTAISNSEKRGSIILPDLRRGNSLALALQSNFYEAVELMLMYANDLHLSLDKVSFNEDYSEPRNLREELLYSMYTYDKMPSYSFIKFLLSEPNSDNAWLSIECTHDEYESFDRLCSYCNITEEEKENHLEKKLEKRN
jgi:hypothetical protein